MRVLLVEDEVRMARAIAAGLTDNGFAVDLVHDGLEGEWLACNETFDVIVLDIMLPGRNGYEICRNVRAAGITTPVLMLTAKDGEYDEADALDLGADDYLRKPFSYVVLIARLNALIRRGPSERSVELVAGDVRLDTGRRLATVAGDELELTPREYTLLEYLLRNAGRVVSKPELLDHVWGADQERATNVAEVYVGYLRRKIDTPGAPPLIRTVRGHGYIVEADDDGA